MGFQKYNRRISGSSLLELVVATGVLTVVISSLFHLSAAAVSSNTKSRNAAEALRLASARLEELRDTDFSDLASGADADLLTAEGGPGGMYGRFWTVASRSIGVLAARDVTVSVDWPGGGSITLMTTIVNPGSDGPIPVEFFPPIVVRGWEQQK